MSIVTADGGLTALARTSAFWLLLFLFYCRHDLRNQNKNSARQSWFSAELACHVLTLLLGIRLIPKMPYGGSVTLFSMLLSV